jgi:hypothetical protein
MNLNQTADDLEAAADLLESETVEWCRGALYKCTKDNDGGVEVTHVCAIGALNMAIGGLAFLELPYGGYGPAEQRGWERRFYSASSVLNDQLLKRLGQRVHQGIPYWNDYEAVSRQEVIDLYKEAAKDLRNQLKRALL